MTNFIKARCSRPQIPNLHEKHVKLPVTFDTDRWAEFTKAAPPATLAVEPLVASPTRHQLLDFVIRSGIDIVKALPLGAKRVLIRRTYIFGLATDGPAGVEHV